MSKKRNRSRNKITRLPAGVHEAVDSMLQGDYTYAEVAEFIRESANVTVSRSALSRYARELDASIQNMRIIQQNFAALLSEMEKYPGLDTTEGIARLLSYRMLQMIENTPEDQWKDLDPAELLDKSAKLIRAISYKRDSDLKIRNIKDIAFDSFREEIFAAMSDENPKLYAEFVNFLNEKQKELEE